MRVFRIVCVVLTLALGLALASPALADWLAPSVVTNDATSITATSASLNGNLTSLGAAASANVSFEWGTSPGAYTANTTAETTNVTGPFSFPLNGLSANTTYYFRAKAVSDNGTDNGVEKSFMTARVLTVTAVGDTIDEGEVATVSGNIAYFGAAANLTATVDWDDGSNAQSAVFPASTTNFTMTHLYLDDDLSGTSSDNYTVSITVSDNVGAQASATAIVTVFNVPPTVNAGPDRAIMSGDKLSLKATFTDPGVLDTHTATINWGDGTVTAGTVTEFAGSGNVTGSHVYFALGQYTVTVAVTDDDGGQGSDSLIVDVEPVPVTIDIRPGSPVNPINLRSQGVIPVAILSSDNFDAAKVDVGTVRFGPAGATPVHSAIEDVNQDGLPDMVLQFRTQDTGIGEKDTRATLTGRTIGGVWFAGMDSIKIVPPDENKGKAMGKDEAPGQNKEPGQPADGKAVGKDEAPGQNKGPGQPADGKAVGKDKAPGQNK